MVQAIQGHFREGGLFEPDNHTVKIPVNSRAIVNIIIDERIAEVKFVDVKPKTEQSILNDVLSEVQRIRKNGLSEQTHKAFDGLEKGDFKLTFEERLS